MVLNNSPASACFHWNHRTIASGETLRVVVVDDNKNTADAVSAALAQEGYESLPVYSGAQAIKSCDMFRPHAMLLDISMPHCDGFATAREIRATKGESKLLILAYTALPREFVVMRAAPGDFDGFCQKGAPIENVVRCLREVST
ncbi:response regulator [Paraburkholderia sp. J41]|uniref:response regulator n=1 Tax=Paraburkholderia sp. J41 TaxID=2805433 RepID=UPI002AC3258F|nr:response regulator [Paraburkholderia sp. J41]